MTRPARATARRLAGAVGAARVLTVSLCASLAALLASAAASAAEPVSPAYPSGFAAFQGNCAVCHGPAGAGMPGLAPPLLSYPARYAASAQGRRQLALTVLFGMFGDITVEDRHYDSSMPDFARLDDAQLAAVLNFVVFDLDHAPASVPPLAPAELAAERPAKLEGSAVREHRKSVAPAGP